MKKRKLASSALLVVIAVVMTVIKMITVIACLVAVGAILAGIYDFFTWSTNLLIKIFGSYRYDLVFLAYAGVFFGLFICIYIYMETFRALKNQKFRERIIYKKIDKENEKTFEENEIDKLDVLLESLKNDEDYEKAAALKWAVIELRKRFSIGN